MKLAKKLRRQTGETIAETLVALLIAAVALMMLAGMISSTLNIVSASKTTMEAYYDAGAALEQQSGTAIEGTVQITGTQLSVSPAPEIRLFENKTFDNKVVYAYSAKPES